MANDSRRAPKGPGSWRLLIHDRSEPGDPRWLIATITGPGDVRPASAAETAPDDVTRTWAGGRLTPLPSARVWHIERDT
jgi:hypothetical protein